LRACRDRPSRRRAAEQRDELAPPHIGKGRPSFTRRIGPLRTRQKSSAQARDFRSTGGTMRQPRRGTSPVACAAGRVHARAFPFALHSVHRSKEAPRLRLVLPCWSTPAIKLICYWIIGAMVESIIRRRCCYVGSNSLISLW
jgi:hypothetical protein